jgi:peptide/nickel transport system ATP-binding protein
MSAVLEVRGLRVTIPLAAGDLHAVRGIDFSVARGETLCIVGESGCGKSLTSLAVMNLLPARARREVETLQFNGADISRLGEREMSDIRGNQMAMVFQEPMTSLNPSLTIGNQLCEALTRHRKVSRREAQDRAVYLLGKVGIASAADRLRQYPHQLSGGLRQRVMIALALMCGPSLIIADEPTTALDVTIQAQILHLLRALQNEFHMALVLVTHDLGVVARVANRVAVMYAGQIVETGETADVFRQPLHPYTRGLLRCVPIPGRTDRDMPLGSIPGLVPSLIGPQRGCGFADRCERVADACRNIETVPVTAAKAGHRARCLFPLSDSLESRHEPAARSA